MWKRKKIDSSKVILASIIVFFTAVLFLSIPVLFNYNSIQSLIEKKFYSNFSIKLNIEDDISLKIFPSPHYLLKKANLDLNIKDDKSTIIETKNLKIFIPIKKIYSKTEIEINKIEIKEANIFFKISDILDFRNHIYYKINEPINIKKSNFFLQDKNNKTILISPIKKMNYFINEKNNSKELVINGNVFGVNYNSNWKRYYNKPKKTINEIKFKNPNISIKNLFFLNDNLNFKGQSSINFLNEDIFFNYLFKNDTIYINSPDENKNQNIQLNSKIDLSPFFFNANIKIYKKNINFLIDYLLNIILNSDKEYLGNINGNLNLEFDELKNSLINKGKIELSIKEKEIKLHNSLFEISNFGKIESRFRYYENLGDLFFASENIFEITNKKDFSRKFQLSFKKIKNINKIYFDLEKNIDNGDVTIFNIRLNKDDDREFSKEHFTISNIQVLKSLLRDIFS